MPNKYTYMLRQSNKIHDALYILMHGDSLPILAYSSKIMHYLTSYGNVPISSFSFSNFFSENNTLSASGEASVERFTPLKRLFGENNAFASI